MAKRAVRLCLLPVDWPVLERWWISSQSRLPLDISGGGRIAFAAYLGASRHSRLICDPWEAVLLFAEVYRSVGAALAESAYSPAPAPPSLPLARQHAAGAELVFKKTGKVVFLDDVLQEAHRTALPAGHWQSEAVSWRARPRCCRFRSDKHDLRGVLDRRPTPFRVFVLFNAHRRCPTCGLRKFDSGAHFGWSVRASLDRPGSFLGSAQRASAGIDVACRMHGEKGRWDYAVPDLLKESSVPGSARRRWTYWPRYNEALGVFEELVTEANRWWDTFLDFSYHERRAMQCVAVFCDIVKDCLAVFCALLAAACVCRPFLFESRLVIVSFVSPEVQCRGSVRYFCVLCPWVGIRRRVRVSKGLFRILNFCGSGGLWGPLVSCVQRLV